MAAFVLRFRPLPSPAVPRPVWAKLSPFPSGLLLPPAHGAEKLLLTLLFLTVLSSAIVAVDIIYNVLSVLSAALFMLLGIRMDRGNLPFILLLIVYNIGGLLSLQFHLADEEARSFMIGTAFVGVTGVFYAMVLNENAIARLEAIKWGAICGAFIASMVGLAGYLGVIDFGLFHGNTRIGGTFRDPNVFGSFAAAACVMLASDILNKPNWRIAKLALFLPTLLALFLSFSRGSWGNVALGFMLLFGLTFFTTRDPAMRARLVLTALVGFGVLTVVMMVVLANDEISALFADRFVLQKDYDAGPSGRFGTQLRAIPDLLNRPFGHGPNRFSFFYPENPHNTYLMAFSSYGWLGGITFLCFAAASIFVSLKAALTRSPFQMYAIMAFATLLPHLVQNLQIDTDRWRHLFMIYGLNWGIAAITARYVREYRGYAHAAYQATAARVSPPPPQGAHPA
jgi:O-antigen ligase